ncbi:hypothetical protein SDC9_108456 [bioreactor metagenome]|uniref:Uncharacterized protein n=1 Tax=bioreactor metagenome TaxID=1076179 RepID=A0A645B967_9ZZZZ
MVDAYGCGENRRFVIVQVGNLRANGVQQLRCGKVKLLEQHFRLVTELANA